MLPLAFALAPAFFVLIWSTGWIVAKYAAPFADPLTFLALRYLIAAVLIAGAALVAGVPLPRRGAAWFHAAVTGVLLHALYLGGVWWAIRHGLPAGISALIAAVQPLMTAALAPMLLGEKVRPLQWAGIGVGFAGVLGVLAPKLAGLEMAALAPLAGAVAVNVGAMVSVTCGTLYQKKFVADGDLRWISTIQYLSALAVTVPIALATEDLRFEMRWETYAAMAWAVVVLSIVAIFLMLWLIRAGAVSRVASLIYLVPPTAAVQAWAMFGETLSAIQVGAMGVAAFGVYLATRPAALAR